MARYTFTYTGIRVRDMDASIDFYTRVLGMKLQFRYKLRKTHGEFALLASPRGHQRLELNAYEPGTKYASPYRVGEGLDHLAFRTPDLRKALRELRSMGIRTVAGPIRSGDSAWVYVEDPNGIWVELIGRYSAARARVRSA